MFYIVKTWPTGSQIYNSSSAAPADYILIHHNSLCRSSHGLCNRVSGSHPASVVATEASWVLDGYCSSPYILDSRAVC